MRTLSILALILVSGVSGAAIAAPPPDPYDDELASALPPPEAVEAAGAAMQRVVDALLDVRVGPLAEAVDPGRSRDPRRRDETLGDLAGRDDPYFEQRMHASIGAMTAGMGEMLARAAALAPVLRDTMDDMERRVEDAVRAPYRD